MTFLHTTHARSFSERLFIGLVAIFVVHMLFPQVAHAAEAKEARTVIDPSRAFVMSFMRAKGETIAAPAELNQFAGAEVNEAPKKPTRRTMWVMVTAYSSTPDQTDSTPYVTAKGTFVRDGVIAANFLPFGTRVRMPQQFGDKEFFVEDRMNTRYWERIDIWVPTREEAKLWGARWVKIELL